MNVNDVQFLCLEISTLSMPLKTSTQPVLGH
jgi:hypothetical protein